jgi:uncharacterized protein (DUF305 family)
MTSETHIVMKQIEDNMCERMDNIAAIKGAAFTNGVRFVIPLYSSVQALGTVMAMTTDINDDEIAQFCGIMMDAHMHAIKLHFDVLGIAESKEAREEIIDMAKGISDQAQEQIDAMLSHGR